MIILQFDGVPVSKGRPRFTRSGHAFTPAKTKQAEADLVCRVPAGFEINGPLSVDITFHFPIPKSWPKAKREQAEAEGLAHTAKPDLDNLAKLVLDALQKNVFSDDSSVCQLCLRKSYSEKAQTLVKIEQVK